MILKSFFFYTRKTRIKCSSNRSPIITMPIVPIPLYSLMRLRITQKPERQPSTQTAIKVNLFSLSRTGLWHTQSPNCFLCVGILYVWQLTLAKWLSSAWKSFQTSKQFLQEIYTVQGRMLCGQLLTENCLIRPNQGIKSTD